jgi:hypothetical protein
LSGCLNKLDIAFSGLYEYGDTFFYTGLHLVLVMALLRSFFCFNVWYNESPERALSIAQGEALRLNDVPTTPSPEEAES